MQTVLIAIDDQVISMLLSEELFEQGYSIRTVSDPWIFEHTIKNSRLDLLVMDEFFGGRRGIDLCLGFRKYLLGTKVLIWASWISVLGNTKQRFPANFHVVKTHALQELTQEIRRRMRQPGVQRPRETSLVGESRLGR
jgi:DNA-binding response OmpR family regulator